MDLFTIFIEKRAHKSLQDIELKIRNKIDECIKKLETNPWPAKEYNLSKIEGMEDCFRIRIGRYRIGYKVDNDKREITVFIIDKKSETTYKRR